MAQGASHINLYCLLRHMDICKIMAKIKFTGQVFIAYMLNIYLIENKYLKVVSNEICLQ